jgi:hypothetical protein
MKVFKLWFVKWSIADETRLLLFKNSLLFIRIIYDFSIID